MLLSAHLLHNQQHGDDMGGLFRWLNNKLTGLLSFFISPASAETSSEDIFYDAEEEIHPSSNEDAPMSSWQIARHLGALIFSSENRPRITVGAALTSANIMLNFFSPYILGELIRVLSSENEEETSQILGFEFSKDALICLLVGSYSLSQIIPNLREQVMMGVTSNNMQNVLSNTTRHLLNRSLDYHVNKEFSDHVYLIQKGFSVLSVGNPLLTQVGPTLFEITLACTALSQQYGIEIGGGLLVFLTVFTVYSAKTAPPVIESRKAVLEKGNKLWDQFTSALTRYKTMHDFGKFEETMRVVDASLADMTLSEKNANNLPLKINLGHIAITRVSMLLAALYMGSNRKRFLVQDFIMVLGYLNQLSSSLPAFGHSINQIIAAKPDLEFVFKALSKPPEIRDLHPEARLRLSDQTAPTITFNNVTFTYPSKIGKDVPLLQGISFTVPPGQIVALVSRSGEGKTSLFNLLYSYYTPMSGTIEIDGQNIADLSLASLQKNIMLIGQTPNLFKGTIRDNICFGAAHSHLITDEMIWALADETGLFEFLNAFQAKLDTDVGEAGKALSGGQQQKIAILRGLFKKQAVIWLLDEITAALDSKSAKLVLNHIKNSPDNVTILMITHKLAEVAQYSDKVVVIDKGLVVAEGTHEKLLQTCHLYSELWMANQDKEVIGNSQDSLSESPTPCSNAKLLTAEEKSATSEKLADGIAAAAAVHGIFNQKNVSLTVADEQHELEELRRFKAATVPTKAPSKDGSTQTDDSMASRGSKLF